MLDRVELQPHQNQQRPTQSNGLDRISKRYLVHYSLPLSCDIDNQQPSCQAISVVNSQRSRVVNRHNHHVNRRDQIRRRSRWCAAHITSCASSPSCQYGSARTKASRSLATRWPCPTSTPHLPTRLLQHSATISPASSTPHPQTSRPPHHPHLRPLTLPHLRLQHSLVRPRHTDTRPVAVSVEWVWGGWSEVVGVAFQIAACVVV